MFKKGTALVPTWLAFAVTRLLEEHFEKLVDYAFTAEMEDVLDEIAGGNAERVQVLTDFYFGSDDREGLQRLVSELGEIDARRLSTFELGDLADAGPDGPIAVRVGRYGTYVEDAEGKRANVADDLPPDELTVELARELLSKPMGEERELGVDPETGRTIVARNGRFGPYVTELLGEDAPKNVKPRTGSLFQSMSVDDVTLETRVAADEPAADRGGRPRTARRSPHRTAATARTSRRARIPARWKPKIRSSASRWRRRRRSTPSPSNEVGPPPNRR